MATPGVDTEHLADRIVDAYVEAERRLTALMASKIKRGLSVPDWQERKLHDLLEYRRQAERIAATAAEAAGEGARQAIETAYTRGNTAAVAELAEALRVTTGDATGIIDTHRLTHLQAEAAILAQAPAQGMVNGAAQAYQQVTNAALQTVVVGVEARRQAAQTALNRFADKGITGFTDRAGRTWHISSYVEMAMRTQLMNAALAGHTDRLRQYGHDLVIVSDHAQECALCRPWEGKVLSLSGDVAGAIDAPNVLGEGTVLVHVAASMDEAREAGLWHPACRHSYSAFQPGVTDTSFGQTADPAGDRARQKLRYLERGVRSWKRREAAALSQSEVKAARARAREWQARIREHVDTTTAKRQPFRERLTAR